MTGSLNRNSVLPGFGLTLGFTLFYLGLIVLVPLSALALRAAGLSLDQFWSAVTAPFARSQFPCILRSSTICPP